MRAPTQPPTLEEHRMSNAVPWRTGFRLDADSGDTSDNAIAGLPTGKFASTFTLAPFGRPGLATQVQNIDASGIHHGSEFNVDTASTGSQQNSAVAGLTNGNF